MAPDLRPGFGPAARLNRDVDSDARILPARFLRASLLGMTVLTMVREGILAAASIDIRCWRPVGDRERLRSAGCAASRAGGQQSLWMRGARVGRFGSYECNVETPWSERVCICRYVDLLGLFAMGAAVSYTLPQRSALAERASVHVMGPRWRRTLHPRIE